VYQKKKVVQFLFPFPDFVKRIVLLWITAFLRLEVLVSILAVLGSCWISNNLLFTVLTNEVTSLSVKI
jgi:hypothetical protein